MAQNKMECGLLQRVKEQELQAFEEHKAMLSHLSTLANLFEDLHRLSHPKSCDYTNREDLIRIFNIIVKEVFVSGSPVVEGFGSFLMNMFSSQSDLDLSLNFVENAFKQRKAKINALNKLATKFYDLQSRGFVTNVQPILTAKVPVLKVTDCGTGIECDISIQNRDGITKSQIVLMIAVIDERFQKLSLLVKAWAKAHGINSSKDGTLNSLSLISLVAFHLQNRDPPILPPFSDILKDGTDLEAVKRAVSNFMNYGQRNSESLAELFVTLLVRLEAVRTLWAQGLCASIYEGSWISKMWQKKIGRISVEDFTDRSQNVARAVQSTQFTNIYKCVDDSLHQIQAFVDGKIEGLKLRDFLFGPVQLANNKDIVNSNHTVAEQHTLYYGTPTKKIRLECSGMKKLDELSSDIRSYESPAPSTKDHGARENDEGTSTEIGSGVPSVFGLRGKSVKISKKKQRKRRNPLLPNPYIHRQEAASITRRPYNSNTWRRETDSTPLFVPIMPHHPRNLSFIPPMVPVVPLPSTLSLAPMVFNLSDDQNLGAPLSYSVPLNVQQIQPHPSQ
ncbi:hypothetical protein Ancab_023260 [Ancistrocladus abbreviatus]